MQGRLVQSGKGCGEASDRTGIRKEEEGPNLGDFFKSQQDVGLSGWGLGDRQVCRRCHPDVRGYLLECQTYSLLHTQYPTQTSSIHPIQKAVLPTFVVPATVVGSWGCTPKCQKEGQSTGGVRGQRRETETLISSSEPGNAQLMRSVAHVRCPPCHLSLI